ncbi:MAG: TIGR00730 family Rossman fold protein [Magnetococcales bacterium]|nr:TIGR00730 family Rossman fold protein [Magnetococcales bacterium]
MVEDFKTTEAWRIFRIQAELIDGIETMRNLGPGPAVTVFGSARTQPDSPYYMAAVLVAEKLSKHGISVITGGGPGIMEAANRGCFRHGGHSIGLNVDLPFEQRSNDYQNVSLTFRYFFVRKLMFVKYADAIIIFPGGFGTLDELFEALTLVQTRKMPKVPIILFGSTYWAGLKQWLAHTVLGEASISRSDLDLMEIEDDPDRVVARVLRFMEDHKQLCFIDAQME